MKYLWVMVLVLITGFTQAKAATDLEQGIADIQHQWAIINYQTTEKEKGDAFSALDKKAQLLQQKYPNNAEPLIWLAIVKSTHAGVDGGLGALSKVKEAKTLLEKAIDIEPSSLQGSAYTSLGSLYYKVPGWPLGFGDDEKAEDLLKKALSINPEGIDPNYFYGEFLLEQEQYDQAIKYLERALVAPARLNRPVADAGRKKEAEMLIAKARKELE